MKLTLYRAVRMDWAWFWPTRRSVMAKDGLWFSRVIFGANIVLLGWRVECLWRSS